MRIPSLFLAGMCAAAELMALDSSDLLFHLSFDEGLQPEFSRGSNELALTPAEIDRRLVGGLFGKGYRFAGKASTIQYYTGDRGDRACWEMYGKKANLFGDSGTLSFWLKPLPNTHNMAHAFFRCDDQCWIQVARSQYWVYGYCYGPERKGSGLYDAVLPSNEWIHIAMTWRKDEARGYFDGRPASIVAKTGVLASTPERFSVAVEGMTWLDFQKKEFEDDCVMDELQIFRRPLTDEEIKSLFERGHMTVKRQVGNIVDARVIKPEREYAVPLLVAPLVATPIQVDGDLADWKGVPAHGALMERRVGVLDDDNARIYAACDAQNLYLGFRGEVDEALQKDPTHVWYPTGQFLANATGRDGDVLADDYVEFILKGKDGHEHRFALNAKGALLDARDGDKSWNTNGKGISRSDFKDWTAELAIPLAELGQALGDIVDFNVVRSWKLFKSAQNSLCTDVHTRPSFGKLVLGGFDKLTTSGTVAAALDSLGQPGKGELIVTGTVVGPAGEYTVKIRGKGFTEEKKVTVGKEMTRFEVRKQLDRPDDMSVIAEVLDPSGKAILTRTIPFVYVAGSSVDLANYPGWGRLEVNVTPVGGERKGLSATVSLVKDGQVALKQTIAEFKDPAQTITFDTQPLAEGRYEVFTRIFRDKEVTAENRQPYVKKARPEWYHCRAGVIDGPPVPWTDVQVTGDSRWDHFLAKLPWSKPKDLVVRCLIKDIAFHQTLFPSQIISNGQSLLNEPIRLRVKRNGQEKTLTAGRFEITNQTRRKADWKAVARDEGLTVEVRGWIEFDGFTWMDMTFSGGQVDHVSLEIPLRKSSATLKMLNGYGLMGDQPLKAPTVYGGYWFGNEKAGFQYFWEHNRDWVLNGESVTITPSKEDVAIAIPFIQKATDLAKPRTITLGWAITPSKPVRKDWRDLKLIRRGVTYTNGDYTFVTPNYAKPQYKKEDYDRMWAELKKNGPIVTWYAFGPYMSIAVPEYADWYREWSYTPDPVKPDPNSTAWGPACHHSSSSDLQIWMLEKFVKQYPQRGIYFDCMGGGACSNEAHGCGYVDEKGVRQPINHLLAERRHYERIYNVIKAADPVYGWVRFHDWGPNMAVAAFCDDNWVGEGMIGPIMGTPEKNYYRVVDIPSSRVMFANEHWGHLTSWLTELACSGGTDKEARAGWYGKMVSPPKDGKRGEWILPRWKDYEHVAGLSLVNDMWQTGGNDLQLPSLVLDEMQRRMKWDEKVRFIGYWETGDRLQVEGGVPEQVICSVYYRPAGTGDDGKPAAAWLLLAPMNNTDADVTVTLRPNLKHFGLENLAGGRLLDLYRATPFTFAPQNGWKANNDDPESPYIVIKPTEEYFPMTGGAARVTIPKRNFRALLLLGANEPPRLGPPSPPYTW